jgi:chromosome partitioning protein
MTKILGFWSPKGGVGKSTESVHMARAAALYGINTLLADADANVSAFEYAERGTEHDMPFDIAKASGDDVAHLARLRDADSEHDLIVVDLPGARESKAIQAMLQGTDGRPVADFLVMPTSPSFLDVPPVARAVRDEVRPLGIPYLVVLTNVPPLSLTEAEETRDELRNTFGVAVADTWIRKYAVYLEAVKLGKTVMDIHGKHHLYARTAEHEQLSLAREVLPKLGFNLPAPRRPATSKES